VIVLLAAKAGLRAGEIANLTWDMVLDPTDEIGPVIELRDSAAKNGSASAGAILCGAVYCTRAQPRTANVAFARADDAAAQRR